MFTFLENALNLSIFTHATSPLPLVKTLPQLLIITSPPEDTGELLIFTRQHFLKIYFSQQQEEVEKTMICFIKIQAENMMNLENYVLITITNYDL